MTDREPDKYENEGRCPACGEYVEDVIVCCKPERATPAGTPIRCYLCNRAEEDDPEVEIRPYGPGGKPLCFDCMMASPEREAEAKRQFGSALDAACDADGVALLGPYGPQPFRQEES